MGKTAIDDYFGVKPELLPYLPDLLKDLWALGSSPEIITEWIRDLNLPVDTTVLDLGCGKGAVSIPLAKEFGFRIEGVDFFEPFLVEARSRADSSGVGSLCNFRNADLRDVLGSACQYDIVIYSSIGFILGSVQETMELLRRCIHPGGYLLIDDGCRAHQESIPFPEYENYIPYDETIRQLNTFGDHILREKLLSDDEMKKINDWNTKHIRRRVEALATKYPDKSQLFHEYLESEKEECRILETQFQGALWLIKKKRTST